MLPPLSQPAPPGAERSLRFVQGSSDIRRDQRPDRDLCRRRGPAAHLHRPRRRPCQLDHRRRGQPKHRWGGSSAGCCPQCCSGRETRQPRGVVSSAAGATFTLAYKPPSNGTTAFATAVARVWQGSTLAFVGGALAGSAMGPPASPGGRVAQRARTDLLHGDRDLEHPPARPPAPVLQSPLRLR